MTFRVTADKAGKTGDRNVSGRGDFRVHGHLRDRANRQTIRLDGVSDVAPSKSSVGRHHRPSVITPGVDRGRSTRSHGHRGHNANAKGQIRREDAPCVRAVGCLPDSERAEIETFGVRRVNYQGWDESSSVGSIDAAGDQEAVVAREVSPHIRNADDEQPPGNVLAGAVDGAGNLRVQGSESAVAGNAEIVPAQVRSGHCKVVPMLLQPVILSAANADARVGRMDRMSGIELRDIERAIQIGPVLVASRGCCIDDVRRAPSPAIIADVQRLAIRRKRESVRVHMDRASGAVRGYICPAIPPVCRTKDRLGNSGASGSAADEHQ